MGFEVVVELDRNETGAGGLGGWLVWIVVRPLRFDENSILDIS